MITSETNRGINILATVFMAIAFCDGWYKEMPENVPPAVKNGKIVRQTGRRALPVRVESKVSISAGTTQGKALRC